MDLDLGLPPETVLEYRQALRLVGAEAGATVIDGPAYFQSNGATIGHFLDQVHPSDAGHALLGAAVAEALSASDL
jgi:lysophospholipase L1-like esterase